MRNKIVIRLKSSIYKTKTGFKLTKTFSVLKRKSNLSLGDLIPDINEYPPLNINEVKDGLYELITCCETTHWESGIVDSYETELVPFKEN